MAGASWGFAQQGQITPLALTGSTSADLGPRLPGLPGAVFSAIGTSNAISPNGDVCFTATLLQNDMLMPPITSSNDSGLWVLQANGTLSSVYRESDAIPPGGHILAGLFGTSFTQPSLAAGPRVAFRAHTLSGSTSPTSNFVVCYEPTPGVLATLFAANRRAPTLAMGVNFSTTSFNSNAPYFTLVSNPSLMAEPTLVTIATLSGTGVTAGNDTTVFLYDEGAYKLVAREDTGGIGDLGSTHPAINRSGLGVFRAASSSGQVVAFAVPFVSANVLLSPGSAATPIPGATFNGSFSSTMTISGDGTIGFRGNLTTGSGGVTSSNDTAIWTLQHDGTGLALVAREGSQVPGLAAGVVFGNLTGAVNVSDGPTVVFGAPLSGTGVTSSNNSVLMLYRDGEGRPLARAGDLVPGGTGQVYSIVSGTLASLNGRGQAVWKTTASGIDFLHITNAYDQPVAVLVEGQTLVNAGPGDDRVVTAIDSGFFGDLSHGNGSSGRSEWFNDLGQAVVTVSLQDAMMAGSTAIVRVSLAELDLAVGASAASLSQAVGLPAGFSVTLTNTSTTDAAESVVVGLSVGGPAGTAVYGPPSLGMFDTGLLEWKVGPLGPGQMATLPLTIEGTTDGILTLGAEVTYSTIYEADKSNDTAAAFCVVGLPGDIAAPTGNVDGADLATLLSRYQLAGPLYDLDGNGTVDELDLAAVLISYGV